MMGGGYGAGSVTMNWVWPVIFVLGMVILIWGLMQARSSPRDVGSRRSGPQSPGTSGDRAREILRERFARGDISEAEMREQLQVLDER